MNEDLKNRYEKIKREIWEVQVAYRKSLKPCPFCGDTPSIDAYYSTYENGGTYWYNKIYCSNCGCQMEDHTYESEDVILVELNSYSLVEKWNNRVK